MTLTHNGKRFKVEREHLELIAATLGKPRSPLFIHGCIKDRVVCVSEYREHGIPNMLCDCCKSHGKSFGGGRTYLTQHVRIAAVADLAAKLRSAA